MDALKGCIAYLALGHFRVEGLRKLDTLMTGDFDPRCEIEPVPSTSKLYVTIRVWPMGKGNSAPRYFTIKVTENV